MSKKGAARLLVVVAVKELEALVPGPPISDTRLGPDYPRRA